MFTNFSIISKSVSVVLLVSCFLLFNSDSFSQQTDRWHPQELETGSNNTWLYAVLGVIAAGTIAYLIFKPSSERTSPSAQKRNLTKTTILNQTLQKKQNRIRLILKEHSKQINE